jgi:hypothetical protein
MASSPSNSAVRGCWANDQDYESMLVPVSPGGQDMSSSPSYQTESQIDSDSDTIIAWP